MGNYFELRMGTKSSLETSLLDQISSGNESAFIKVYENYWKQLFNFGYKRLKKKEVVEGIVQEVFVELWLKRENLCAINSLEAYLFTMVKYMIINHVKSLLVKDRYNQFLAYQSKTIGSEVEEKLLFNELDKAYWEEVKKLSPQARKVYQMRHVSGLKYAQIASKLDISVSTVEKHMIKAKKVIRTNLKHYSN